VAALSGVAPGVWLYRAAFLMLTAVGVARIVSSSSTSYQTSDEGLHIGCGVLWMNGRQGAECLEHPPLARIAAVLPLSMSGVLPAGRSSDARSDDDLDPRTGKAIVALRKAFESDYERTLRFARLGILPFFLVASGVVWIWAGRLAGHAGALAATFLFQGLPPVIAHAGLVTTDMAVAAFLPAALYLTVFWMEEPSAVRSALLGLAIGLAVLAKHSAGPFLAAGAAAIGIARWVETRRDGRKRSFPRRLGRLCLAGLIAFFVAWAGYRFSSSPAALPANRPHRIVRLLGLDRMLAGHPAIGARLEEAIESPIPLGGLVRGILLVASHNATGHPTFFRGEFRSGGWWYFFPFMIAVKTPVAFLVLAALGGLSLWRAGGTPAWQRFAPLLAAAAILLLSLASRIDIGVRHVLAVYPLLAIVAGVGLKGLASMAGRRAAAGLAAAILAIWFVASSARAHPDPLSYFNELAGRSPERITADSDLDWGQDVKRLFAVLHDLRAERLSYACLGCLYLKMAGPFRLLDAPRELQELEPYRRVSGWVAVSEWARSVRGEMERRQAGRSKRAFDWLDAYPFRRIGRSIRLYHVRATAPGG
jgi:dolichyl-phosphate-mannose-protein mannosyltransferase